MSKTQKMITKIIAVIFAISSFLSIFVIFNKSSEESFAALSNEEYNEVASGANLVIGGGYAFGKFEPLKISINYDEQASNSTLVGFYQKYSESPIYQNQYSIQGSGVVVSLVQNSKTYRFAMGYDGMRGTADIPMQLNKTYISTSGRSVRREFICTSGDVNMLLQYDITYNSFSAYYDTSIKLTNLGAEVSDVRVFYGADVNIKGTSTEKSNGYYDPISNVPYIVHNPVTKGVGSVWLRPSQKSPLSKFFVGEVGLGLNQVRSGALLNNVQAEMSDEAYFGQWNYSGMNQGGSQTVSFSECWSDVGYLQMSTVGTQSASAGSKLYLDFILYQKQYTAKYKLAAYSKQGYQVELLGEDVITLGGADSVKAITVKVTVPSVISKPVIDEVILSATCIEIAEQPELINSIFLNKQMGTSITVNGSKPNLQDIKTAFDYNDDTIISAQLSFIPQNVMAGTKITGNVLSSTLMSLGKETSVRVTELNGVVTIKFENLDLPLSSASTYFFDVKIDGYEDLEDKILFTDMPLTQVMISGSTSEVYTASGTFTFTGTSYPVSAVKNKLKWTSSSPSVATIDASSGVMTPISAGTTKIRLASEEYPSLYSEITLVVKQGVEKDSMSIVPLENDTISAGHSHNFGVVFSQSQQPENTDVVYSLVLGSHTAIELKSNGEMRVPITTPIGSEFIVRATSVTNPTAFFEYKFSVSENSQLRSVLDRIDNLPSIDGVQLSFESDLLKLNADIISLQPQDVADMVPAVARKLVRDLIAEIERQKTVVDNWVTNYSLISATDDGLIKQAEMINKLKNDFVSPNIFKSDMRLEAVEKLNETSENVLLNFINAKLSQVAMLSGEVATITEGIDKLAALVPRDSDGNIIETNGEHVITEYSDITEQLYALCTEKVYTSEQKELFKEHYRTLIAIKTLIGDVNIRMSNYNRRFNSLALYSGDVFVKVGALAKRTAMDNLLSDILKDVVVAEGMKSIIVKLQNAKTQIANLINEYTEIAARIMLINSDINRLIGQKSKLDELSVAVAALTSEQRSYIITEIDMLNGLRQVLDTLLRQVDDQRVRVKNVLDAIETGGSYISGRNKIIELRDEMLSEKGLFSGEQLELLSAEIERVHLMLDLSYRKSDEIDFAVYSFEQIGIFERDALGNIILENGSKKIKILGIVAKKDLVLSFEGSLDGAFFFEGELVYWTAEQRRLLDTVLISDINRVKTVIEDLILQSQAIAQEIVDRSKVLRDKVASGEIDMSSGKNILGFVVSGDSYAYEYYLLCIELVGKFDNLIEGSVESDTLGEIKKFLTDYLSTAQRIKEQIDIIVLDNERRAIAGNTIAISERGYINRQLEELKFNDRYKKYTDEQILIAEHLNLIDEVEKFANAYIKHNENYVIDLNNMITYANSFFSSGGSIVFNKVYAERQKIAEHIRQIEQYPPSHKKYGKWIEAHSKLCALKNVVDNSTARINFLKEPIDQSGVLISNTETVPYKFRMENGKRIYSFNQDNFDGLLAFFDVMNERYLLLKQEAPAADDTTYRAILQELQEAYKAIFAKIDELLAIANDANEHFKSEFFALSYWERDALGNILIDEYGNRIIRKDIIYDMSIESTISDLFARMKVMYPSLTEEQIFATEIGREIRNIYDLKGNMADAIQTYLKLFYDLGIWELSINGVPRVDNTGNFIIVHNGLINKYENQINILLEQKKNFTHQQLADEKMVKLFAQVDLLEPVYMALKADIDTIKQRLGNLNLFNADNSVKKEGLLTDQNELIINELNRIISRLAPISGNRYLTVEQKNLLDTEYTAIGRVITQIDVLKNEVADFVTQFERFEYDCGRLKVNLFPKEIDIMLLLEIEDNFTTEQQALANVRAVMVLLDEYVKVLEEHKVMYAQLFERYGNIDKSSDGLIGRYDLLFALSTNIKDFQTLEPTTLKAEVTSINELFKQISNLNAEVAAFDEMVRKISADEATMISRHFMVQNAFDYFKKLTAEQQVLSTASKNVLDSYEVIYNKLMQQIEDVRGIYNSMPVFAEDGSLDLNLVKGGDLVMLRDVSNVIIDEIAKLNYEQKNKLIMIDNVTRDIQLYLGVIAQAESIISDYNALLGSIDGNNVFYSKLNEINALLGRISGSYLTAMVYSQKEHLEQLKLEAEQLIAAVEKIRADYNEIYLAGVDYRDNVIKNRVRIENLYLRLHGDTDPLTREQLTDLEQDSIVSTVKRMYNTLNDILNEIDEIRNIYNEIIDGIENGDGLIAKKSALEQILYHITTGNLTQEQKNNVVDIKARIERNIAEINDLNAEIDEIIRDIESVHTDKSGLIGDEQLLDDIMTNISTKTKEQIAILQEYGIKKFNYIKYAQGRIEVLNQLKADVDMYRQLILPLSDYTDGMLAHADVVRDFVLKVSSRYFTSEQLSLLVDATKKANAMLVIIAELEKQVADLAISIDGLPDVSDITKNDSGSVSAAYAEYSNLTKEQKEVLGNDRGKKILALNVQISLIENDALSEGIKIKVSDEDLSNNMFITVEELKKETHLYALYSDQIKNNFGRNITQKIFKLSANYVGANIPLSQNVQISITAENKNYYVVKIRSDGTMQRVDAAYNSGNFMFSTREIASYALVSIESEMPIMLFAYMGCGAVVIMIFIIILCASQKPKFVIVQDGNVIRFNMRRLPKKIKSYKFYVNGFGVEGDSAIVMGRATVTMCYSTKRVFYFSENISEMTGSYKFKTVHFVPNLSTNGYIPGMNSSQSENMYYNKSNFKI